MPGELERLIQALLAPRQQTQVQTPSKLALSYETLDSLSESVSTTYPLPTAAWWDEDQLHAMARGLGGQDPSNWDECVWS